MASSPLILAALAKAALPPAKFKQAKAIARNTRDPFNSAVLTDADGIQYVVREARGAKGNLFLATETHCLRAVKSAGTLPFRVPNLLSETLTSSGRSLQILEYVYGSTIALETVSSGDPLLRSIGLAIASIHNLNLDKIRQSGLPEFSPAETRAARTADLDRAAATGRIPAALLQRWESALEDLDLFRFQPTVVHGNVISGSFLELDGSVSGVGDWSNLHIGDPAEDFVTFAANLDPEPLDSVKFAYFEKRDDADSNLAQRATLYSELALATYLVNSLASGSEDDVDWASTELEILAKSVAEGSARVLSRVSFAQTFAAPSEPVDELVITETKVIVSETKEEVDLSDLKTRPIELPTSSDDQLF
jgi:aminoglycoside phosphotransferase (APT) family kinase protein